ncbi:beta carbonic anhydrase 5, chloroplastic isoform X1 [Nicotiana tabacum]|uniref:Carbonic anhydrase n=2 Tax=Nicotiana TaxID=4085 RepID=A0A1S4AZU3_TOBAC|nr:PREDICTED: beta carbonic anhydrase 5, chloroplastic-like isoform X1 [Nicotiana sylvestris]XP_016482109.1 PREDICTED: beta carbonic anhydrase 5, chloroplastic-like isoform X1 [Nicotiana tabacum]
MARSVIQSSSLCNSSSVDHSRILRTQLRFLGIEQPHFRLLNLPNCRYNSALKLKALKEPMTLTKEMMDEKEMSVVTESESNEFTTLKHRFLNYKKDKYMKNLEHFQSLAETQSPKFMVISCADSRVCPSNILGFQPGEAFVVRNVANLVPPYENGPSETNAALEFAVNTLKVQNILVIGHSRCGGIRALMSMDNETPSSFIRSWVVVGKSARASTKAAASNLSFDQQCKHCEKESVNCSLMNLFTYPWIKDKVNKGELLIHGGYYDFVDCTFEKWTLENNSRVDNQVSIRNREFWC